MARASCDKIYDKFYLCGLPNFARPSDHPSVTSHSQQFDRFCQVTEHLYRLCILSTTIYPLNIHCLFIVIIL